MKLNAYRDGNPDEYWRRRVFLLAAGLVVLGLLAWAVSGSGGGKPGSAGSGRQPVLSATGLPAAAYGSAAASGPPSAGAVPAFATASPTPARSRSPKRSPRKRPRTRHHASAWCPSGSVVMTVFTSRPSYQVGQHPVFTVYAVSTVPGGCEMRFGPAAVRIIVTRHGRVVWNSSQCPAPAARTARLRRGVPAQMSVTWNRRAAFGCRGWLPANSYGNFSATARARVASSPAVTFELVR
jgi:hypothetical protein